MIKLVDRPGGKIFCRKLPVAGDSHYKNHLCKISRYPEQSCMEHYFHPKLIDFLLKDNHLLLKEK
jgi:hypothetical protein